MNDNAPGRFPTTDIDRPATGIWHPIPDTIGPLTGERGRLACLLLGYWHCQPEER